MWAEKVARNSVRQPPIAFKRWVLIDAWVQSRQRYQWAASRWQCFVTPAKVKLSYHWTAVLSWPASKLSIDLRFSRPELRIKLNFKISQHHRKSCQSQHSDSRWGHLNPTHERCGWFELGFANRQEYAGTITAIARQPRHHHAGRFELRLMSAPHERLYTNNFKIVFT